MMEKNKTRSIGDRIYSVIERRSPSLKGDPRMMQPEHVLIEWHVTTNSHSSSTNYIHRVRAWYEWISINPLKRQEEEEEEAKNRVYR